MARSRQSHESRERLIITDLEQHFPNFAGSTSPWNKVPDGEDPPDFLSKNGPQGLIGLELVEWLDGQQMTVAKTRESLRAQVHRILSSDWQQEYQPQNFRGAFVILRGERIDRADEAALRKEFYALAAKVDATWSTNPDRQGESYMPMDFYAYPVMAKYLGVRFLGGEPHGLCWIHEQGDGGAYDPAKAVDALNTSLDNKLMHYSRPEQQQRLKAHGLAELTLLVHHGFNAFAYNTPSGTLSLEEIAQRASTFYAGHAKREVFNRVWIFDSLDSAEEINQLMGFEPDAGHSRWLAQVWPDFRVY